MKMNYEEFKEMLKTALEERFEGKANVYFKTIVKRNDVNKESLVIEKTEEDGVPTISLTELYEIYSETRNFEHCLRVVQDICLEKPIFDIKDLLMTWEEARERIQMRLVKKEWNTKKLEHVPYQEYLDFAVVFYVVIGEDNEMITAYQVNNEMAKRWGVGLDELWATARENLEKEQFFIKVMEALLDNISEGKFGEEEMEGNQCVKLMYVMSNEGNNHGARVVLRKDILRELANEKGRNLYLLPASVHEWILCIDNGRLDVQAMKWIVHEVNRNPRVIRPEECLSDSVYYYDREQNEVRIVA